MTKESQPINGYIHHRAVSRLARRFNADPHFQYKLHLIATYMWLLNMAAATAVFFLLPGFWSHFSVLYLVLVSLYANFATDYDGVSSSEAAIHAQAVHQKEDE